MEASVKKVETEILKCDACDGLGYSSTSVQVYWNEYTTKFSSCKKCSCLGLIFRTTTTFDPIVVDVPYDPRAAAQKHGA